MKNKEQIIEVLDYLRNKRENKESFVCDEEAIIASYQKNRSVESLPIKILSIFGGLLASLAFVGFLFISGLYDSGIALIILGLICIVAAILVNKKSDKIILDTVTVLFYIIGFLLMTMGFNEFKIGDSYILLLFVFIASCSLIIVHNYILSFISILIINGCIFGLILTNDVYNLIHIHISVLTGLVSYIILNEAKIITNSKALCRLYKPLRAGLIFSFLVLLIFLGKRGMIALSPEYTWLSSVIIFLAIIYLMLKLSDTLHVVNVVQRAVICILSILVLLPTVWSPAISGAILIILLSFYVNYKTGMIVGVIAFIYFISQYYYDLNFTLLTKSMLLISSGILFLALYLFTRKSLTKHEKI
ncbi:DUF4401 domain-containing protein [Sphingobacterium spiritivorum]|uniref:DUF4401 domain-containing protein n=1 Tax=Sphingobacterium spiritivorum TaxID=258 RepID=UPI00191989D9|nr:DUF4401 domain-containing protein [Sphingobacterium spiritivorum]QQT25929.1 DUF4401 domain-containing protein [Sphingobacterium spiritivorum]